jgi:hypothetical protein
MDFATSFAIIYFIHALCVIFQRILVREVFSTLSCHFYVHLNVYIFIFLRWMIPSPFTNPYAMLSEAKSLIHQGRCLCH